MEWRGWEDEWKGGGGRMNGMEGGGRMNGKEGVGG